MDTQLSSGVQTSWLTLTHLCLIVVMWFLIEVQTVTFVKLFFSLYNQNRHSRWPEPDLPAPARLPRAGFPRGANEWHGTQAGTIGALGGRPAGTGGGC